jgi:hypothetical protein
MRMRSLGTELVRPLSFGQEGVELQQQIAGGSPIFNVPAALELTGTLDRRALGRSLTEIVRRHDVLRTTFEHRADTHVQVVRPAHPVDLPVHDLRQVPAQQRDVAAQKFLDTESARPFDLQSECGLRCLLVVLDDNRHVFFWNMHHIVCDGWSKSVFANELSLLYAAFSTGRHAELSQLPVNYGDFVAWQRRVVPEVLDAQLAYWDTQLAGVEDLTGVAPDRPRSATRTPRGEDIEFGLSVEVRRSLAEVARRNGATLFMVLHTALVAVLHRISGQLDIVISVPYGGRPSSEFEPLIGFFVNVLAMRSRLQGDPSFRQLLGQVRATALDGYEHHQVPFQRVAERVAWRHGGRADALHQTSLAFQNLPYQEVRLAGLTVRRYPLKRVDIRYEIELHMWEDGEAGGLGGRLIYRPDLFDRETATGWTQAYLAVLNAVAADPDVRMSKVQRPLPAAAKAAAWSCTSDAEPDEVPSRVEPRTATEVAVTDIWVELLHFEDIAMYDSFLDIGGHSLLVALMVSKIRSTFDVDLSVRQILQNPTVDGIAGAIDAIRRQRSD